MGDRRPHLALRAPHARAPLWPRALLWHLRASCTRAGQKPACEEELVCRAGTSTTRHRPTGECMGTLRQWRFLRGNIPRAACAFEFALATADDRVLPSSCSFPSSWCGSLVAAHSSFWVVVGPAAVSPAPRREPHAK